MNNLYTQSPNEKFTNIATPSQDYSYQSSFVFDSPPPDFNAKFDIVAVFILVKNEILFVKRHPNVAKGNTWAIIAGKFEKCSDSNLIGAAKRELFEETGINNDDLNFLSTVYIREPGLDYTYHMFSLVLEDKPNITLNPNEATEYKWLNRDAVNMLNMENKLILDEMPCIQRIFGNKDFSNSLCKP